MLLRVTCVLIRTYIYLKTLGWAPLPKASEIATLEDNYMMARLKLVGCTMTLPDRHGAPE